MKHVLGYPRPSCSSSQPAQDRRDLVFPSLSYVCCLLKTSWTQSYHYNLFSLIFLLLFCYPCHHIFGILKKIISFSHLFSSPTILFSPHCFALCPVAYRVPSVICLPTIMSFWIIHLNQEWMSVLNQTPGFMFWWRIIILGTQWV